jgi:hypothetical protein
MSSTVKMDGWFSRRHKTNEPLLAYRAEKDRKEQEQYAWAQERTAEAAKRTPQEQLKRLDKMFGKGLGAKRERKRLVGRIKAAAEASAKAKKEG